MKNLELPLTSEPSNMGMVLLTDKAREENTFESNKDIFLSTLDERRGEVSWANSTRGGKTKCVEYMTSRKSCGVRC